jgi:hypothetical protein
MERKGFVRSLVVDQGGFAFADFVAVLAVFFGVLALAALPALSEQRTQARVLVMESDARRWAVAGSHCAAAEGGSYTGCDKARLASPAYGALESEGVNVTVSAGDPDAWSLRSEHSDLPEGYRSDYSTVGPDAMLVVTTRPEAPGEKPPPGEAPGDSP